jgi:signal transduction histidine kinase/AmiR/NasT family two-component response regulator
MSDAAEKASHHLPQDLLGQWGGLALRLVEILDRSDTEEDHGIKAMLNELRQSTGVDAIAFKLRRDGAWMEFDGERQMLVGPDRRVCEPAREGRQCLCGKLLFGEIVVKLPSFTANGSFWSNDYGPTVASSSEFHSLLKRGTCVRDGYRSIANILLRSGDKRLGILHLADRRPNRFSPDLIEFLERLGTVIGLSLTRGYAARELKVAKDHAEAANRAKSEFLANMSHEIRTPMNAIVGFTDLVLEGGLTEDQRQSLEIVKSRSQDLLRIIDDILDLARIEADQMGLIDEPFRPREAVASAAASVSLRAQQKGLVLRTAVADRVPAELRGDSLRLRQVLLNLLSNAIKFTAAGSVEVEVDCASDLVGPSCDLRFSVRDTGIGIPRARQAAIFEPFIQADSSTVRTYGGTGLGLTICRRLVEKMGGEIGVTSEPGQGATFRFTASFRRMGLHNSRAIPVLGATSSGSFISKRILIAEDDPTSRMLVANILRRDGHAVDEVADGEAALASVREADFDLVFMDVQMPEMDGLAATQAIRALANDDAPGLRRRAQTPIVALTAHAMRGDRERCLAAGMNGYITKPVQAEHLRTTIREYTKADEATKDKSHVG